MNILHELAQEIFRAGKPLNEVMNDLVEELYNNALNKAKALARKTQHFESVRDALVADGLPPQTATSIAFTAGEQVAKEIANEKQLREATETAIALFKNGCRFDSVVNGLQARGCTPDLADRVAKENQHHYR
jgi:hypothetical protein